MTRIAHINDLFKYNGHRIRTAGSNEKPLFVAKDVCDVLGILNVSQALSRLNSRQKGISKIYTLGGEQELLTITEAGLYKLVIRSNRKQSEKFTDWVTEEVLPAIRRKGFYGNPEAIRQMIRLELAKERLAEYLHYSDIFNEESMRRFMKIEKNLYNFELARIFGCSKRSVQRVRKLLRNAQGDFSDQRPDGLKTSFDRHPDIIEHLKHLPATQDMKEHIYELREYSGRTFEEIAEITGYSVEWCRQVYNRIKLYRQHGSKTVTED